MSQKNIKLSLTLDAKTGKLVGGIKKGTNSLNQFKNKAAQTETVSNRLGASIQRVGHYVVGAFAVQKIAQFTMSTLRSADAFDTLQQRIKTATIKTGDYVAVQQSLLDITKTNGAALADSVLLFQSLARASDELGASNRDILKLTNTVQQLGVIGGASAANLRAGLQQFSQAMSAGIVRAEEMNSLLENIPEVANRIAKGMGLTSGELRKAVLAGTVLSKDVFQSLLSQSTDIAQEFENIPLTMARASTTLGTSFDQFFDKLNESIGLTASLAKWFQKISVAMDLASGNASRDTLMDEIQQQVRVVKKLQTSADKKVGRSKNSRGRLNQQQDKLNKLQDEYNKKLLTGNDLLSLQFQLGQKNAAISGIKTRANENDTTFAHIKFIPGEADDKENLLKFEAERELLQAQIAAIHNKDALNDKAKQKQLKWQQSIKDAAAIDTKNLNDKNKLLSEINALTLNEEQQRGLILNSLNAENKALQQRVFLLKDDKKKEGASDNLMNSQLDEAIADEEALDVIYAKKELKAQTLKDTINDLNISTKDYGDTWARTGNQILDAMGSVMSVMDEVNSKEADYAKNTLKINTLKEQASDAFGKQSKEVKKLTKDQQKLDDQRTKNSVKGSMAMLDASVGMFKEGSKAQKTAHQASLAMHTIKLGMNIAEAISAATVSVAEQGKGDPYTAWGRIAAMSVMMGGLLSQIGASFGGSGGSSPDLSVAAQKNQGTGTILGDSSAKSESLANTFDLLSDINVNQYAELQQINLGIQKMNGSLEGVSSSFARGGLGGFNGQGFNLDLSNSGASSAVGRILGSKTRRNVTDGGVDFGAMKIGDLMNGEGLQGQSYSTVKSVSSAWYRKSRTRYATYTKDLDRQSEKLMGDVFAGLGTTMLGVADNLGLDYERLIKSYSIDLPKISLHNMTGDEINTTLQNMVSAQADTMAQDLFGSVALTYQKAGEGLFETLSRITMEKTVVNDELKAAFVTLGNDALATTQALVALAGGLDDFTSNAADYYDAFFSEQEKHFRNQQNITKQLAEQNIALPKTRDGYRDLVEALDINTKAGQEQYTMLTSLAEAADDFYSVLDDLTDSLIGHYNKIIGTVTTTDPLSLINAQTTISDAIAQAQQGNLPTADSLNDALSTLSSNSDKGYQTLNDFKREQLINANLIDQLTFAATDKTIEEHMLEQLQLINLSTSQTAQQSSLTPFMHDGVFDHDAWEKSEADLIAKGYGGTRIAIPEKSHADGLAHVPFDNYTANLHQGEAVIDARTMQGMRKYGLQTGGDSGLKDEIIKLRQEVSALRNEQNESQYAIALNTHKLVNMGEKWDNDGTPEVRV